MEHDRVFFEGPPFASSYVCGFCERDLEDQPVLRVECCDGGPAHVVCIGCLAYAVREADPRDVQAMVRIFRRPGE